MKLFVWNHELSYLAVAHAESMAKAREMLIPEIGGWDGSCPERTKARLAVEEKGAEIWQGPIALFAVRDSEMTLQLRDENESQRERISALEAQLAAERQSHENQRIAINQVSMSKRNEYASWDEIVAEIRQLQAEAERVAELERENEALRIQVENLSPSAAEEGLWNELEADRERLDWLDGERGQSRDERADVPTSQPEAAEPCAA